MELFATVYKGDRLSLSSFKRILDKDKPIPNKLFFYGERRLQILHARLRNNW